MVKILFVCSGNICRSPMAEAVLRHMAEQRGLGDQIFVDSAGTGSWHIGETAHSGTRRVLAQHNILYNGRARQLAREDLNRFDYILAMDRSNLRDIQRMAGDNPRAEIRLFLSYVNDAGLLREQDVPDPYYQGNFEEVYELVHRASRAFLDYLSAKRVIR